MSRARTRDLPVLRVLVLFAAAGVWAVACGGPQSLGGPGSVCFRADDCQAGLACVPETTGATKHVCSADLSGIVSMVDGAPPDGEMPEAAGGAPATPQGGSPAAGGMPSEGAAGKPAAAGGSPGSGGKPGSGGAPGAAGAPAGGSPGAGGDSVASGGSSAAGGPSGGSESASAGTGG